MFLRPLLGVRSCPLKTIVRHTRGQKPNVQIAEESFQLTLYLHEFDKDEICVKAHPSYVVVEGTQVRSTPEGDVVRKFVRKYKLPKGCQIKQMKSQLTPEGVLTVIAPRAYCKPDACETIIIPIDVGDRNKYKIKEKRHKPCDNYNKVKPIL